jgi:hypothetical protein
LVNVLNSVMSDRLSVDRMIMLGTLGLLVVHSYEEPIHTICGQFCFTGF